MEAEQRSINQKSQDPSMEADHPVNTGEQIRAEDQAASGAFQGAGTQRGTENRHRPEKQFKTKGGGIPKTWIWLGLAAALAAACIFTALYGMFRSRAASFSNTPLEQEANVSWLYRSNHVLYRDLYNAVHNTELSYEELYYPLTQPIEALQQDSREAYDNAAAQKTDDSMAEPEETQEAYDQEELFNEILQYRGNVSAYFNELEARFPDLNELYDYMVLDTVTLKSVTNTGEAAALEPSNYHFYLKFCYDENGNVTIGDTVKGEHADRVRKLANEVARTQKLSDDVADAENDAVWSYIEEKRPVNCEITYGITQEQWNQLYTSEEPVYIDMNGYVYNLNMNNYQSYRYAGSTQYYILFLLGMFLLALLLPWAGNGKPWKALKICRLPLEGVAALGIVLCILEYEVANLVFRVSSGKTAQVIDTLLSSWNGESRYHAAANLLAYLLNISFLTALFALAWYGGICFRSIREEKIMPYIRQHSLIYRIFPFVREKLLEVYDALTHFDVTRDAKRLIMKIVLLNAVVLFIISSLWMGGIPVAAVYSVLLYFLLKKYVSSLQKKYSILLSATNEIAQGNLNVNIVEDLGVFEPFKPQIIRIQQGFSNAVEEEVKSQRMKAELITNVSHDLKTPLTAITTYIGLLKDEAITAQQRREYLDILERKSQRLKVLIEDLFEVSKATTQNMTLNIMDVDIMNLIKQVGLEMSDKLENAKLDVRMNLSDTRVILPLDSQKTYRIYENLFGNIAKYALPGTRVYVNGFQIDDTVVITLKNITAEEIHVSPEELTDRFVRGDVSRNTEGSGLGLAIAKSFTELQGGRLEIEVDGDLFKVTTTWKIKTE